MRARGTVLAILALGCGTSRGEHLDTDSGAAATTDADRLDLPPGSGCERVDFLFVVDNSRSMEDHQANLATSFPGFMSTIRRRLNAQDYQIMVVDTDAGENVETCSGACPDPSDLCSGFDCDLSYDTCDRTLGAGVVRTAGAFASNTTCPTAPGVRFLVDDGTDPGPAFSCLARVGTSGEGASERPMEAMVTAVSGDLAAPGACNEGFLREDALLVVTVLTDEEDDLDDPSGPGSAGDPVSWHDALVAAKGGREDAVVVLGLIGDSDQPDAVCPPWSPGSGDSGEPSPRLRALVESFGEQGVTGSVCADDYTPFFLDAVDTVDAACDLLVP